MEYSMLRKRARANLAGCWGVSIGIAVVAALLGGLIAGVSFLPDLEVTVPFSTPAIQAFLDTLQKFADSLDRGIQIGNFTLSFRSGIFGFAAFILGGTLQLGYADFLLKQHDGKHIRFNDLFSKFDLFGTGFAQRFLRSLYTFLWSLLFIIPGIIKGYAYAMTPFILAEHPNMTVSQAIRLSEELMDGYKSELFVLDLTFIGWNILVTLTWNLGNIALNPYKNAAYAAFYRQIQAEKQYTIYES